MILKKIKGEQQFSSIDMHNDMQIYEEKLSVKNSSIIKTIETVNELLQYMTSLDYVKDMIKDANIQSKKIESVTSSSEEMTAATESISHYIQESNHHMTRAIKESSKSLEQVDMAFVQMESNIQDIFAVKDIMDEVKDETTKINELVNMIKGVANKTNLLSLNASIEAARAGEHGRGFSVVAEEIKKLSENTKEQVDIIQGIVEDLNLKINKATAEMENVFHTFSKSKVAIDNATSGMKNIGKTMSLIEDSLNSITSSVEDQTLSSQEISLHLQNITEKSVVLRNEADRTGQAFFDISEKLDEIRINAITATEKVDSSTLIKLSITDHLMWKWRVYNMILGFTNLDTSHLADHNSCRLGKWITSLDTSNSRIKTIVNELEKPHENVHKAAKQAIEEYNKGNQKKAEELLINIEANSKLVVDKLKELETFLV